MSKRTIKKPKRHIRKSILVFLILCLTIGILAWQVPKFIARTKLKDLGYDKVTIKEIQSQKLTDTILTHKYYSNYLADSIRNKSLNKDYLSLYASISSDRTLEAKDFLLYNRLLDKGYEEDQLDNLFNNLTFYELTPLLVFDYQWDENPYIEDCKNHRDTNSETSFTLSDSYLVRYKLKKDANTTHSDTLVNSTYTLSSDYVPSSLTDISTQYAVAGIQLDAQAAEAFTSFAQAGVSASHNFYATTGYISYEIQDSAYNSFLTRMTSSEADKISIRPGHSEHQTGLAVNVAATFETSVAFQDTETYQWLCETCTDYGFIQRYPAGKETITGISDELGHFRYVGKDLAKKIKDSSLTFDEYYCLYLAKWEDEKDKPSKTILNQISEYDVQK